MKSWFSNSSLSKKEKAHRKDFLRWAVASLSSICTAERGDRFRAGFAVSLQNVRFLERLDGLFRLRVVVPIDFNVFS